MNRCRTWAGLTRRAVLAAAGAAALTAAGGCAVYGAQAPPANPAPPTGAPGPPTPPTAPLARAADIPVGGGMIFPEALVVVTQPRPGTYAGFSATCTHQGCTVTEVTGGTINCPCHGSRFALTDGAVVSGPAPSPLPRIRITEQDGALRIA